MEVPFVCESRIEIPGICAEVRTVTWDLDHEAQIESDRFMFSSALASLRFHERTVWRFPESSRQFRAAAFGLLPAHFPVMCSRNKGPVRALSCSIDRSLFAEVTGFDHLTTEQVVTMLRTNAAFYRTLLARLADEIREPGFASAEMVSSLVHCLLVETARTIKSEDDKRGDSPLAEWQMRKVREAISDAIGERHSIESLARLCGIGGRHLMRGFKASTGLTIHGYIEQVRLEQTKQMLAASDLPLKAIAANAGFASASHMSSAFKRLTGRRPSEYRWRHRGRLVPDLMHSTPT